MFFRFLCSVEEVIDATDEDVLNFRYQIPKGTTNLDLDALDFDEEDDEELGWRLLR